MNRKRTHKAWHGLLFSASLLAIGNAVGCSGADSSTPNENAPIHIGQRLAAATGQGPVAMAVVDLNQDGMSDVLVVNGLDDTLSVFMQGEASGLPSSATTTYPTGRSPSAIAVADLDGDLWPEVLVTNSADDSLSVYKNTKMSIGALQPDFVFPMIPSPIAVTAGDVNGDGKADVVVSSGADFPLTVLRNDGTGMLIREAPLSGGKLSYGLVLAQLTATGRPDLVLTSAEDDVVRLIENDGSGNFGTAQRDLTVASGTPVAVVAAPLDDNDSNDLLIANYTKNQVRLLLNQGGYVFKTADFPTGRRPLAVATGSLRDNFGQDRDFVVACQDHVEIFLGSRSGTFVSVKEDSAGRPLGLDFGMPAAVAIADVNGDQLNELLVIDRLNNRLIAVAVEPQVRR